MAEYEGNVLRPPGMGAITAVAPPEELIAAYNPPPLKKGGTVQAGVGVLRVGEPMKYDSNGYLVKSVFTSGSWDTVDGLNETAVDCTTESHLINIVFGGVINVDVAAITAANAAALATAVGGKYLSKFHYIKF